MLLIMLVADPKLTAMMLDERLWQLLIQVVWWK